MLICAHTNCDKSIAVPAVIRNEHHFTLHQRNSRFISLKDKQTKKHMSCVLHSERDKDTSDGNMDAIMGVDMYPIYQEPHTGH